MSIGHKNKKQIRQKWKSSVRQSWIKCQCIILKRLQSWGEGGEMIPLNSSTVQMENKRMFSSFILWLNVKYTLGKQHYLILAILCVDIKNISPCCNWLLGFSWVFLVFFCHNDL